MVVRNVANLVLPYSKDMAADNVAATIELAVNQLQVKNIVVMGHSDCSGIKQLMTDNKSETANAINQWLQPLTNLKNNINKQYVKDSFAQKCSHCEKDNIKQALKHLTTYPCIKDKLTQKRLSLHGWYFNLTTCDIEIM